MDVRERFEQAQSGMPLPPPQDPRKVFRRGRRRRHRRIGAIGGGTVLAASLAVVIVVGFGTEQQLPAIVDQPDATAPAEQAPAAGAVNAHWPIELVYQRRGGRHERFRGNSWGDWSLEVRAAGAFQLVDREHPSVAFDTEGGEFYDRDPDAEDFTRAPGPHLIADWRNTTGLIDRIVVPIDQIPGGDELIDEIGLAVDQVEGYITPNIVGCTEPLATCIPEGETGARGIAHLPTGFPLFAEEGRSGERSNVWIEAISMRWADADIEPVPVDAAQPEDAVSTESPLRCPEGTVPLLDVEEYPDASTRGKPSPIDAVRDVARSAEQVEETPFSPDPLAPVWIVADDVTYIATSLPDGSWFASPATLVQCDDPQELSYPRDPTIEGQDLGS